MFIDPIQLMQFGEGFQTTRVSSGTIKDVETLAGQTVFADVFRKAIDDVIATEDEYQKQKYLLATGQTDDPHAEPVKAQLAVDLLVQLRNKALDAYSEIMRINL